MDNISMFKSLTHIAVVGAHDNPQKFGYKVLRKLLSLGMEVYPVNPFIREIDGMRVYQDISEIGVQLDAVSFIVNPNAGFEVLKKMPQLGVGVVWFQPGAESEEIVDFCQQHGIICIYNECVLVRL